VDVVEPVLGRFVGEVKILPPAQEQVFKTMMIEVKVSLFRLAKDKAPPTRPAKLGDLILLFGDQLEGDYLIRNCFALLYRISCR